MSGDVPVFVVHAGVIAGCAPGMLKRLSELGVVLVSHGPIDQEALLMRFHPDDRHLVRFTVPEDVCQAARR